MVKIYFGKDSGFTTHTLYRDLKRDLNFDEFQSVEKYDGYKDPVSFIVEACQSLSLFEEKKTIVVTNAYFFLSSEGRKGPIKEKDQDYQALEDYLMSPSPDTDLYISVPGVISRTGTPNKALSSPAVSVISCDIPSDDDFIMLAYKRAKEEHRDIDPDAAKLLLERTKGDYLSFMNNLDKLFAYTKYVKKPDVEELVYKPLEDNVFRIVSSLIHGNISEALKTYQDLRNAGNLPLNLLPVLAFQFQKMALVRRLKDKGYSKDDIAHELSMSSAATYYALKDVQTLSFKTLLAIINDLGELEKHVKLDLDDPDVRMTLFFTLFAKNYLMPNRH